MTIAACINKIGQVEPKLNNSLLKADRSVYIELFKLIETEKNSSPTNDRSFKKEQLQERLFLLYNRANKKAIAARNQGKVNLWQTWEQIVDILDLACEYLENNSEDDFYLLY